MLEAKSGSIVNIGSMSGFIVNKPQEQCYYNASKAAVHHLTKSLAAEWGARGVRVNAVAPTYIATPLNAFVKNNPQMYDAWIGGTPMAPDGGGRRNCVRRPVSGVGCRKPDDRKRRSRRWRLYVLVGLRGSEAGLQCEQAFIGIDVGTSSARAGMFDERRKAAGDRPASDHGVARGGQRRRAVVVRDLGGLRRLRPRRHGGSGASAFRRQGHGFRCDLLAGGARRRRPIR